MKNILFTFILLFCTATSFAQRLAVESFTHDAMNLEARLDGGRTDLNGRQCALVKVMVRDDIMECKGGNVGDIISKGIVKKIFVSPTAKYLEFEFKYSFPLKVTFSDYGYATLAEGATYIVTLVDAYLLSQQPAQQSQQQSQQQPQQQSQQQSSASNAQTFIIPRTPSSQSALSAPSADIIPFTVNGVTFNMIKVDGGTFMMGATGEQENPYEDEKPVHQVIISTYYIGETEVTQALWQAVMEENPSEFKGSNLPVENVSWYDCQKFIEKLNILTSRQFRLPTEAEWEFAARGGNKSRDTQYSGSKKIADVAWYAKNSKNKTHPVKTKKANELGIYDMSGNVWERCYDYFKKYESYAQTNPIVSESGTDRVCRGGGCINNVRDCRSAYRNSYIPINRNYFLGLRLVLSD